MSLPIHRTKNRNRDGITLLFVISMVVLFLLMGTAFMVVANDYFRTARQRSRLSSNRIDSQGVIDRAFYELLRGPGLGEQNSPLRGQSILADQYGYGVEGMVFDVTIPTSTGTQPAAPFVVVRINATLGNVSESWRPGVPLDLSLTTSFVAEQYNGRVFSVLDGPLSGISKRIIASSFSPATVTPPKPATLDLAIPRANVNWLLLAASNQVLINGRDFSGTGAGSSVLATDANLIENPDALVPAGNLKGADTLEVNRIGEKFYRDNLPMTAAEMTAAANTSFINVNFDGTGAEEANNSWLSRPNSVNESYDAADYENMFLSGVNVTDMPIPSFHRASLFNDRFARAGGTPTAEELKRFTFRPVAITGDTTSTATVEFFNSIRPFASPIDADFDGTVTPAEYQTTLGLLDVDTDNDGTLDSVWIDIGLADQTDNEGRKFRPLIAYQVRDMDALLNVNAHGSIAEQLIGTPGRGSGYGPAEISLSGVTGDYAGLLSARHGTDDLPGVARANAFNQLQKLYGYPVSGNGSVTGGYFQTGSNLLGQYTVQSSAAGEMPSFDAISLDRAGTALTAAELFAINPYRANFSLTATSGDSFFEPYELETLLRPSDSDQNVLPTRLVPFVTSPTDVTTDSFEVPVPTTVYSAVERLRYLLTTRGAVAPASLNARISGLLPRDLLLGRKLDLNRPFDTPNGAALNTAQFDNPNFATTGLAARQAFAKDLYITALLACGDKAPMGFTVTTPTAAFPPPGNATEVGITPAELAADLEYRKLIAQWAINIVDYRDADSIMTPFEFDIEPFDSRGWEVTGDIALTSTMITNPTGSGMAPEEDVMVVWGVERPELLLTETFASHDRQTNDVGVGMGRVGTMAPDEDDDWDSVGVPVSNAVIEIYSPWFSSSTSFYSPPAELANGTGTAVDLDKATGGTPVWRIGLKERRSDQNSDIVRSVYFTDPSGSVPAIDDTNLGAVNFFPSAAAPDVFPGSYVVAASASTLTVGGRTVALPTGASAPVLINMPRPLSVSDPDIGYVDAAMPPMPLVTPADIPLDTVLRHRISYPRPTPLLPETSDATFAAIWKHGVTENFRFAYLQRLANPDLAFNADTNPYLTVDVLSMGLLAFNSGDGSPDTHDAAESTAQATPMSGAMTTMVNNDEPKYDPRSVQRGETFVSAAGVGKDVARRNLFVTDEGDDADDPATLPTTITSTFGLINSSMSGDPTPLGCLFWNNRPFASVAEIANVPYLDSDVLPYAFNTSLTITRPTSLRPEAPASSHDLVTTYQTEIIPFFGDANHFHLPRFTTPLGGLTSNRLARIYDFVEVPNRFLGSETFLAVNAAGNTLRTGFAPPDHFISNFRVPGKININTVRSAPVWTALAGGLPPTGLTNYAAVQTTRAVGGPTDFPLFFGSSEARELVPDLDGETEFFPTAPTSYSPQGSFDPNKGSAGTIASPLFDAAGIPASKDIIGTAYFRNEARQRLAGITTTRSSVFSIWITVGYFSIDQQGKIGAEIGSDDDTRVRNRAFFIVDRSIPVAFEPGENHNVDDTVLVRTIIE